MSDVDARLKALRERSTEVAPPDGLVERVFGGLEMRELPRPRVSESPWLAWVKRAAVPLFVPAAIVATAVALFFGIVAEVREPKAVADPPTDPALPVQLTPGEMSKILVSHNREFTQCINKVHENVKQNVVLTLQIEASGKVSRAEINIQGDLAECLRAVGLKITFPKHQKGPITLSLPIQVGGRQPETGTIYPLELCDTAER